MDISFNNPIPSPDDTYKIPCVYAPKTYFTKYANTKFTFSDAIKGSDGLAVNVPIFMFNGTLEGMYGDNNLNYIQNTNGSTIPDNTIPIDNNTSGSGTTIINNVTNVVDLTEVLNKLNVLQTTVDVIKTKQESVFK